MAANDPRRDLPLLAAIAEGEDVGDEDYVGRAEATLGLGASVYRQALARLAADGLVRLDGAGEPAGVTTAGRARLRPRIR